jgi:prolyl-tRNA synthetase
MLGVYADFAENHMAMPVIQGEKTAGERFPGAVQTFCIEAMMQDRKALQAGTSHFLGQNFAKASGIQFTDVNNKLEHAWTTSWGVSTRLVA